MPNGYDEYEEDAVTDLVPGPGVICPDAPLAVPAR